MVGIFSLRVASRIHIAVWASWGPTDRYSAMPSMNQSGIFRAEGTLFEPIRPCPVMANWNACTSSCPST